VFEKEKSRLQFKGSFQKMVEEIQRKTLAKIGISLISKEDRYYFSFV